MLMTGDPITAQEAHRLGMVNELHPQAELMDAARRIAEKIASNSPTAAQAVKRAVRLGQGQPTEQAIAIMMEAHWRSAVHPDRIEGIGAFNEGRDPTFLKTLTTRPQDGHQSEEAEVTLADDLDTRTCGADDDPRPAVQRRGAARSARDRHHADRAALRPQQLRRSRPRRPARDRRSGRAPAYAQPRRPEVDARRSSAS